MIEPKLYRSHKTRNDMFLYINLLLTYLLISVAYTGVCWVLDFFHSKIRLYIYIVLYLDKNFIITIKYYSFINIRIKFQFIYF